MGPNVTESPFSLSLLKSGYIRQASTMQDFDEWSYQLLNSAIFCREKKNHRIGIASLLPDCGGDIPNGELRHRRNMQ